MKTIKKYSENKNTYFVFIIFAILTHTPLFSQNNSDIKTFQAGAYSSDITPPLGLNIVGGSSNAPLGKLIHDNLYAKTLILDDGKKCLVFIIIDNLGVPAWLCTDIKKSINLKTKIPTSNILISSTHTHSSVSAGSPIRSESRNTNHDEYQTLLIKKITQGVELALANRQKAEIGWGSLEKPQYVFNRRWYVNPPVVNAYGIIDSVKTNPGFTNVKKLIKPAGPVDPEVSFIVVKSLSNEYIAVLANYSLHYVGGVPQGDISADYFGEFGLALGQLLNPQDKKNPFVGIMTNGTSGDINNIDYSKPNEKSPPYIKISSIAHDIAESVADKIKNITYYSWVPLKISEANLSLKVRKPSNQLVNNLSTINNNRSTKTIFHSQEKKYSKRAKNFIKKYPKEITITLQTFAIGDLAIGAIPFEVFAETGLELKKQNKFKKSFIIGLANGHWGYLPTPEQFKKGGYETLFTVSRFQEESSKIVVDKLLELFNSL